MAEGTRCSSSWRSAYASRTARRAVAPICARKLKSANTSEQRPNSSSLATVTAKKSRTRPHDFTVKREKILRGSSRLRKHSLCLRVMCRDPGSASAQQARHSVVDGEPCACEDEEDGAEQ